MISFLLHTTTYVLFSLRLHLHQVQQLGLVALSSNHTSGPTCTYTNQKIPTTYFLPYLVPGMYGYVYTYLHTTCLASQI